jgi:hypothetical protein
MDMARIAGFTGSILGHERNGLAMLLGDFLDALLKDQVHVGHGQGCGASEIDFVLAAAPFALAALDGDARGGHAVADGAHERFVARRLHQVIIDAVIARWLEITITAREGGMIGLVEQIKLQFAGATAGVPVAGQGIDLAAQDRAGRLGHQRPVMPDVIAQDERGAGLPRDEAQSLEVGLKREIAKARIPTGDFEAIERVHFHVDREQVIASVRSMFHD